MREPTAPVVSILEKKIGTCEGHNIFNRSICNLHKNVQFLIYLCFTNFSKTLYEQCSQKSWYLGYSYCFANRGRTFLLY